MSDEMTVDDGKSLIELARFAILSEFDKTVDDDPRFEKLKSVLSKKFGNRQGVFVTLNKDDDLRGCIGYPEALLPLYAGVMNAAKSAAFQDPRFNPVTPEEMAKIDIEISVLTVPKKIEVDDPKEIPGKIVVGRHGIIVKYGTCSGLLLPQVAKEYGWDAESFLEHTCMKAALSQDIWLDKKTGVFIFEANIFSEKDGAVVKKD